MVGTAARYCSCQRSTLSQSDSGTCCRHEGQRPADWPTERSRQRHSQWNACPHEKRHQPASRSSPRQKAQTMPSG
eukprot:6336716-Alexandrium_andersonii.AAC.1